MTIAWRCLLFGPVILIAACGSDPATEEKTAAATASAAPPNIVFIVADDVGAADVPEGAKGRFPTPNLDRLAAQGVRFASAYTSSSASGPARAGVLTGRHPSRMGYEYDNLDMANAARQTQGLPEGELTLAELLRDANYASAAVGAWKLGGLDESSSQHPLNSGFDGFFGFLGAATPHVVGSPEGVMTVRSGDFAYPPSPVGPGLVAGAGTLAAADPPGLYLTDKLAAVASRFVADNAHRRFFLYFAPAAAATPLQALESDISRVDAGLPAAERAYGGMIVALDRAVGDIMAALDNAGVAQETLLVFTSDGGCSAASGACSCSLKGAAPMLYEGALRVPFVLRWPSVLPEGATFEPPVSTLDAFATALKAAGRGFPAGVAYDGVDLVPHILGDRSEPPHTHLFWSRSPALAVRWEGWKLLDQPNNGGFELYNLADDPGETRNLAESQPDMLSQVNAQLHIARSGAEEPLWMSTGSERVSACGADVELYR